MRSSRPRIVGEKTATVADPAWLEKWNAGSVGNTCAGVLILSANMCKRSRDRAFPTMEQDKKTVFETHKTFLDHHNNAQVKSWEMVTGRWKKPQ
jgi:hypothetical protein